MRYFWFGLILLLLVACGPQKQVLSDEAASLTGKWLVTEIRITSIADEALSEELSVLYAKLFKDGSFIFNADKSCSMFFAGTASDCVWDFGESPKELVLTEERLVSKLMINRSGSDQMRLTYSVDGDGILLSLKKEGHPNE